MALKWHKKSMVWRTNIKTLEHALKRNLRFRNPVSYSTGLLAVSAALPSILYPLDGDSKTFRLFQFF
jgi:hypothetical protein